MNFTNVINININNVDLTDQGKEVYKAILRTGARSTEELLEQLPMTEGEIDFMLAHLYRHDLIRIEHKYESKYELFWGLNNGPR